MIERIVSGGQTGADRAALDFAIDFGIVHGGWCPQGRLAEDGDIPDRYQLTETNSDDYAVRTEANVRDADATVIFSTAKKLTRGSLWTRRCAERLGKPWLHLYREDSEDDHAGRLVEFVSRHAVKTLNIAGPRQSTDTIVGEFVYATLRAAIDQRRQSTDD